MVAVNWSTEMDFRKLALAPIAAALMTLAAPSANADTAQMNLEYLDTTSTSGPWGTVTLTEGSFSAGVYHSIDVKVDLVAGVSWFVDTGNNTGNDQHTAFTFNMSPAATSINVSGVSSGFAYDSVLPDSQPPFGTFTNGISCTACGNGGSNPVPGPLLFTISSAAGISIGSPFNSDPNTGFNLVSNSDGWWFAADLIRGGDPVTGQGGVTGNVAARNFVTSVPEPEVYAMLLAGLGFMGFVARRRKQQVAS
jgi:hypothetical protein